MEAGGTRLVRYGPEDAEFSIWAVADIHYSNKGCLISQLIKDVQSIHRDPYALWSLLGDYCDWIVPGDKRYDPACVDKDITVDETADFGELVTTRLLRYFHPIAGKCIASGYGNHDLKYYTEKQAACLHGAICSGLKVPNLRYSGFVVFYFERVKGLRVPQYIKKPLPSQVCRPGQRRLIVFQHHGFGAANTPGGKLNTLKREIDMVDADLVMMGHVHESLAKPFIQLCTDPLGLEIRQKPRMGMITGSYLRGHVSGCTEYSEVKGYSPTTLGASRAIFRPADGHCSVETGADGVGVVCG